MDAVELVKTAHAIDCELGELAVKVTDESLRNRVLSVREGWKELTYAITAELCEPGRGVPTGLPKRRGRPRREERRRAEAGVGQTAGSMGQDLPDTSQP